MIAGATYTLPVDVRFPADDTAKVIITLKNLATSASIVKYYPSYDTVLLRDGRIGVKLSQQDTVDLCGRVSVEAQINLVSGGVAKTMQAGTYINATLHTEFVDGAESGDNTMLESVPLIIDTAVTPLEMIAVDTTAVHYDKDNPTKEQKKQARENIGAASAEDVDKLSEAIDDVYTKTQIDAIMGSYINDLAAIAGGDA